MENPGAHRRPLPARLAVVFADPLRHKIVTELSRRAMSAQQFFAAFGGGSAARVARHFARLEEYGWLERVGTRTGGRRRGAVERFYRATGPPSVDDRSWAEMPNSVRATYSRHTFEQLTERIETAMRAGSFDARSNNHFTWTPLLLDRNAWKELVAEANALFDCQFEVQERAMRRIAESGEEPFPTTTALAAFESPREADDPGDAGGGSAAAPRRAAGPRSGLAGAPLALRLSKVFDSPLRLKIVTELNRREMSASQFAEELGGGSVPNVSGHFRKLEEYGWLEQVRTETGGRRRGAVERFYRATGLAIFDNPSWSEVPDSIRATYSWYTFEQLAERIAAAMRTGSFDARCDRHFSWTPLLLDRRGWEELVARTDALFAGLFETQASVRARLARSGKETIPATVALAVFESPRDSSRAP